MLTAETKATLRALADDLPHAAVEAGGGVMIERAISIALSAHAGQVDKGGAPYILHPLRVMSRMTDDDARIVAVLHDVVEDTDWTFNDLQAQGFSASIIEALDCLTRRKGESYEAFIERLAHNPLARRVKLADLSDNMDGSRLGRTPTAKDTARYERYRAAMAVLHPARTAGLTPRHS